MDDERIRSIEAFAASPGGGLFLDIVLGYFQATLIGAEHIPGRGGALIVANHGLNGWDGVVLGAALHRDLGRIPYWLGEKNLWRIPMFGRLADFINAIPGERAQSAALLERGEIVVVYPGGVHDSFKTREARNVLQWGKRAGFARVAMKAGVPIVPVAAHGVDDMYTIVARERWLGRTVLGDARYDLPIAFGRWGTLLPKPVKVTLEALPAISTAGDPGSEADVERVRSEVYSAVQTALLRG